MKLLRMVYIMFYFSGGELNDKFEGDILLTKEQENMIFGLDRTGLVDINYRWPNSTIPYELSTDFEQHRLDDIELALRRIEEVTCLRFIKRTDEVNYVYVTVCLISRYYVDFY